MHAYIYVLYSHSDGNDGIHLGKPGHQAPPKPLDGDEGVLLDYTAGDDCGNNKRYSTRLLLICNRNIPVVSGCRLIGIV